MDGSGVLSAQVFRPGIPDGSEFHDLRDVPLTDATSWPYSIAVVALSHLCDGFRDQFFQDRAVDISQLLDVEATLPSFVFPEAGHQLFVFQAGAKIQHKARLSRRESRHADLAFAAALVLVVVFTEADDCGSPHFWAAGRSPLTLTR